MSRWTPAEKQAVTGLIAPYVRSKKSAERRVGRLPVDLPPDAPWAKNVVGYTTLAEGQKALLAKHALEIDLLPDKRPKSLVCEWCGKPFPVAAVGLLPIVCPDGCVKECACGAPVSPRAAKAAALKRRDAKCKPCIGKEYGGRARPYDRRETMAKVWASMTDEQRAERVAKTAAARHRKTP